MLALLGAHTLFVVRCMRGRLMRYYRLCLLLHQLRRRGLFLSSSLTPLGLEEKGLGGGRPPKWWGQQEGGVRALVAAEVAGPG
jgi:hypothetical protein